MDRNRRDPTGGDHHPRGSRPAARPWLRAGAALLAAGLTACAGGETWLLTFGERRYTRCVDELDTSGGSYEQDSQANALVLFYEGPRGALTVGWTPTLTGERAGDDFEAGWVSERTVENPSGEGGYYGGDAAQEIYLHGAFQGRTLTGILVNHTSTTSYVDGDGDGVPEAYESGCYTENDVTGWKVRGEGA